MPNPFAALIDSNDGDSEDLSDGDNGDAMLTNSVAPVACGEVNVLRPINAAKASTAVSLRLAALPPMAATANFESAGFDVQAAGFSPRDLATCIRVIKSLGRSEDGWSMFKSKVISPKPYVLIESVLRCCVILLVW